MLPDTVRLSPAPSPLIPGRRAFVGALAIAALVGPSRARAQTRANQPRIGWLTSSVVHDRNVGAFRRELRALGYDDVQIEVRAAAGQMDRLPALAGALVAQRVDVLVIDGGPAVLAARKATTTVPIVIGAAAIDLVQQGVVASMARPGGNITGFLISTGPELDGKRLELLCEAVPASARVAVVWNPRNELNVHKVSGLDAPARARGVAIESVPAANVREIERALPGRKRIDALLFLPDAYLWSQREAIVALVAERRLPAMYPEIDFAEAGGLLAYGPAVAENFRRAAGYVDRILKGARPGELPIERPSRIDLLVNLKAARALGLTIPQAVLVRAAQVIE